MIDKVTVWEEPGLHIEVKSVFEPMLYSICKYAVSTQTDTFDKALLLNTMSNIGMNFVITEFDEEFSQYKEIFTEIKLCWQSYSTGYYSNEIRFSIEFKLHPNILKYTINSLRNIVKEQLYSNLPMHSYIDRIKCLGFDNRIELSDDVEIDFNLWSIFANYGHIYNFKSMNCKQLSNIDKYYICEVNASNLSQTNSRITKAFGARENMTFNVCGALLYENLIVFKHYHYKVGYVVMEGEMSAKIFQQLKARIEKGVLTDNFVLYLGRYFWTGTQKAQIKEICSKHNIEYYFDFDNYSRAMKKYAKRGNPDAELGVLGERVRYWHIL